MEMIAAELVETGAKRDGRGRRLALRAEALAAIAAYEKSGLTQKAFAEREGLKFATFTGWLKRYRGVTMPKPAFTQVRLAGPSLRTKLVVKLPSGVVIRGNEAAAMAELVRLLGC